MEILKHKYLYVLKDIHSSTVLNIVFQQFHSLAPLSLRLVYKIKTWSYKGYQLCRSRFKRHNKHIECDDTLVTIWFLIIHIVNHVCSYQINHHFYIVLNDI